MIEIEISKDLKDYEPKFLGPFTTRQTICVVSIAAIMGVGYNVIKNFSDSGLQVIIPLFLCLIPILIGWYKPNGMKFENYFVAQLYTSVFPPKKRKYRIENMYELFEKEIAKEEQQTKSSEKTSKNNKNREAEK